MSTGKKFTRQRQQIAGLIILIVSLGFIIWTWHTKFSEFYYYPKAGLSFPLFAVIGLGLILVPDYRSERINRGEDISKLSGLKLLTVRWWLILFVGLAMSFINSILLNTF